MRVRVYRNLNNQLLSIMAMDSRLVLGHCTSIRLANVNFRINESGRQRVILTKRKNVHAFAEGEVADVVGYECFRGRTLDEYRTQPQAAPPINEVVRYNPYNHAHFTNEQGDAVSQVAQCIISCTAPFTRVAY